MRRKLSKEAVLNEPHLIWNAFVDLVATEDYERMTQAQQVAHLVFWYDSEVQNGGHYQYFANSAGRRCNEALDALVLLGLECQALVLHQAIAAWGSENRVPPTTTQEFLDGAPVDWFDRFDTPYDSCRPAIMDALQGYLEEHQEEFIIIEDAS